MQGHAGSGPQAAADRDPGRVLQRRCAALARARTPPPTAAFMRRRRPLARVPPGTLHSGGLPSCMVAAAAARRAAACSRGLQQKPPNRPQPPDAAPAPTRADPAALTPLYEHLCTELGLPKDESKAAAMRATNEQRLKELEDKAKDAEENLGETEVRDALHARAEYLGRIGDREAAAKAYAETEEKTASGGAKADMVFSQIRCVCEGWAGIGGGVGRCVAQCFGE